MNSPAWTFVDWDTHSRERAAIFEYDQGMSRAEAEAQAVREIYDKRIKQVTPGIFGELLDANRRRYDPRLAEILRASRLECARGPVWGFADVVIEGDTCRPPENQETGRSALIVPASEGGRIIDYVAMMLDKLQVVPRLGVAEVVGADKITAARESDEPLRIFSTPWAWLRGCTLGAVIVNWKHASYRLDGVQELHCNANLAPRLHSATRDCWPQPRVVTYKRREAQHAA